MYLWPIGLSYIGYPRKNRASIYENDYKTNPWNIDTPGTYCKQTPLLPKKEKRIIACLPGLGTCDQITTNMLGSFKYHTSWHILVKEHETDIVDINDSHKYA